MKKIHLNTCMHIITCEYKNFNKIKIFQKEVKKTLTYTILNNKPEIILKGTPKSVQLIFNLIEKADKPLRVNDLQKLSNLTDRTIRLALNRLYKLNLVIKIPNLQDLRSHFLTLSPDIVA